MSKLWINIALILIFFFSGNAFADDSVKDRFIRATEYYQNLDISNAIPLLESVIGEIPDSESEVLYAVRFMLSSCYYQNSQYDKALPLLEKLNSVTNAPNGFEEITPVIKLHLMNAYVECNQIDKADDIERLILTHIDEYDKLKQRSIYVELMTNCISNSKINQAIEYADKALSIEYLIKDDLEQIIYEVENNTIHMALFQIYNDREEFEDAIAHAQKAIENTNQYVEQNLPVICLGAAIASDHLRKYDLASSYLQILASWLDSHPDYIQNDDFRYKRAVETGSIQLSLNNYIEAIKSFEEAVKYCQEDEDNRMYCLSKLYYCYENTGNIKAKNRLRVPIYQYASKAHLSSKSQLIAYHSFARILKHEGNVNYALAIFEKLLDASQNLFGKSSFENFTFAYEYVDALHSAGKIQDAMTNVDYLFSLADSSENNRKDYLNALIFKAMLLGDSGNVGSGIDLLTSVETEVLNSGDDKLKWNYLNGKSHLACMLGDFESALKYDLENLLITKRLYGENSQYYGIDLLNIGEVYAVLGNRQESLNAIQTALDLFKSQYGEFSPLYYNAFSKYCNAITGTPEEYVSRSAMLSLSKEIFGEISKEHAEALIFSVPWTLNPSQVDIEKLEKALSILNELNLRETEEFLSTLYFLSVRYFLINDWDKLLSASEESLKICRGMLHRNFVNLTPSQREGFWNRLSQNIHYIPSHTAAYIQYAVDNNDYRLVDRFSKVAYNCRLLEKGLLLTSTTALDHILSSSQNDRVNILKNEIFELETIVKNIGENSDEYAEIRSNIDCKQRELLHIASENGDYTDFMDITWETIKENLSPGEAAIEFFSYPVQQTVQYAAAWVTYDSEPLSITLFTEDELNRFANNSVLGYDYDNPEFCSTIWKVLNAFSELSNCHTWYFSPDGILNALNIELLRDSSGYLANNYKRLIRVSSTREVTNKDEYPSETIAKAAIFGGLDYDLSYESMAHQNYYNANTPLRFSFSKTREGNTRGRYANLEWTLPEVKSVSDALKMSKNISPELFIGKEGSEEIFYSLSGRTFRLIHLATHGFYYDDDEVEDKLSTGKYGFLSSTIAGKSIIEDKTLTHSGLILSGGNNALRGISVPKNREDGILTAYEISKLDLNNVDLVVLSACETGLGDLKSEGVYGLQRGFKKAGVTSILMSLWEVNDEATGQLMKEFYRNYAKGFSKSESLHNAQKSLMDSPLFSSPKYWAGWILLDALD